MNGGSESFTSYLSVHMKLNDISLGCFSVLSILPPSRSQHAAQHPASTNQITWTLGSVCKLNVITYTFFLSSLTDLVHPNFFNSLHLFPSLHP